VRIAAAPGGVEVDPLDEEIRRVVEHLLGLPFDLPAFAAWADGRPVIGELAADLAGFRPPLVPDPFESLVTSITAQQISLRAASAIRSRLVAAYGDPVGLVHAFPTRERVAAVEEHGLVELGFSRRKAQYVVGLARSPIDLSELEQLGDDEVRARLVALPGIGAWTAEWFLARHLARPTAWPAGDLALRRAVDLFYGSSVHVLGPLLHPFQNLSAHYLLTGSRMP
jgi:DNA-3-methyladenine glycosylase II